MTRYKCPNCGNTNRATMEDNGLRRSHPDYTLLCVARIDSGFTVARGARGGEVIK